MLHVFLVCIETKPTKTSLGFLFFVGLTKSVFQLLGRGVRGNYFRTSNNKFVAKRSVFMYIYIYCSVVFGGGFWRPVSCFLV